MINVKKQCKRQGKVNPFSFFVIWLNPRGSKRFEKEIIFDIALEKTRRFVKRKEKKVLGLYCCNWSLVFCECKGYRLKEGIDERQFNYWYSVIVRFFICNW